MSETQGTLAPPSKTKALNRDDWLAVALDALLSAGVEGIRVEVLARQLGVTKGSFYWHFSDRQELLDAVLNYWTTLMIGAARGHEARTEGWPAKDRLLSLMEEIAAQNRGRFDVSVRAWAAWDIKAAKAVAEVDAVRMAYGRKLFRAMGFSLEQADLRSRMAAASAYAEPHFSVKEPLEKRLRSARLRHAVLIEGASGD